MQWETYYRIIPIVVNTVKLLILIANLDMNFIYDTKQKKALSKYNKTV